MLNVDVIQNGNLERDGVGERIYPFVKWVGGKQALAPTLVSYFPTDFTNYFEPFLGGGSVLLSVRPEQAYASDQNNWLIDTYNAVKDDWKAVAKVLDKLENTRESFLEIRKIQPQTLQPAKRAAHFIYLNKTCFRGLFRVNKQGQFNVPYGEYDRRYYSPENLKAVSDALQHVNFHCCDFEETATQAKSGDFVYFDPPYYKLGGFSDFNRYTANQFREMDHVRLASLCNELDKNGVRWAVSNSDTPLIRSLFEGHRIEEISARREINLKSQSRNVVELLIMNY
jgi:DNA adenine methylase